MNVHPQVNTDSCAIVCMFNQYKETPKMTAKTRRHHFFKTPDAVSATAHLTATPMSGDQQLALTATQAVAAMKAGTLTATAYVTTLIARARSVAKLNAMISLDEAGALVAAKQIDADRAAGKTMGALAGLPIVVKDNINSKAMKTTAGTSSLNGFHPVTNAPSLQKPLDAGAILLGKSNLHEFAFGVTTTNFTLGLDPSQI